ncbi:MAG: helix-turn-helix domain-containing protein [Microthrixaceae bacterium]
MRLQAEERRKQLLAVAVDVFAEKGFHAASMNDVAEAAGVTKPVLYQHFTSKRDLFVELLDEIGNDLRETIAKAIQRRWTTSTDRGRLPCVLRLRQPEDEFIHRADRLKGWRDPEFSSFARSSRVPSPGPISN